MRTSVLVWVALLALTGLNVALAQIGVNSAIGLAVASVQAVLIAVFLMHLRISPPLTQIVGVAALVWLAILLLGTLDDVLTRGWLRL
jgi:caa(3)-type oxidase subunit IV